MCILKKGFLKSLYYPLLLIGLLLLFISVLENRYAYYFLHDDNINYSLPLLVHNYRSLLIGELPLYNFHQYLGTELLSCGQPASLYPLIYIAVFLSKFFFGHYFATIEILVLAHLIIGSIGMFVFIKGIGLDDRCAFFGAITWPLSSFIIYVSSSWWHVSGLAAYFPWMIYFALRLLKENSYKNLIALVIVRLLIFYIGHVQFFVYAIIIECLTVFIFLIGFWLKKTIKDLVKTIKYYLFSVIITLLLSFPLFLPMWHLMKISGRSSRLSYFEFSSGSYPIYSWIVGLVYPFSNVFYEKSNTWLSRALPYLSHVGYVSLFFIIVCFIFILIYFKKICMKRYFGKFSVFLFPFVILGGMTFLIYRWRTRLCVSYVGCIFLFFIIICSIFVLICFKRIYNNRRDFGKLSLFVYAFFILGGIVFFWSAGFFNRILYLIPVYNRFRWIFRMNIFTNFYLINLSAIGLYLFLRNIVYSSKNRYLIFWIIIFIEIANFSFLYLSSAQKNFRIRLENIPLEEPLKDKINTGRIISMGYQFEDQYFANGICFDYATLWGLYHFAGYEQLITQETSTACLGLNYIASYEIEKDKFPIDYFRIWGVKWYIVSKKRIECSTIFSEYDIQPIFEDDNRIVFFDKKANPLFYWKNSSTSKGIDYDIKTNFIRLKIKTEDADSLIINFLSNPFFTISMNGKNIVNNKNEYNQITVYVPRGRHTLVIKYGNPYFWFGCRIALFSLLGLIVVYVYKIFQK